jgi:putative peptide zinc metalloprotease protein
VSVTIEGASGALVPDGHLAAGEPAAWPQLLPGTELIGQAAGSGLREPPYLVRRRDGELVQLSQLFYVLASHMDGRELAAIADGAGARLGLRIAPEQVAYVAEHKLTPLGLLVGRDGSAPRLERRTALLALKFRAGIVPGGAVNALASVLRVLFWPPVVVAALSALVACDVWLGTSHGTGAGMRAIIRTPALGLALLAFVLLAVAFHECGHAAACRYGGARPGRIGIGIYLIWPIFYTDVTDSYCLSKAGRVRTDLGGVYFNALFALAAAAAYFSTGYEPLLVLVVTEQILILDQFIPWARFDGYYVVGDLVGVPDLFARIKPVIASLVPGRHPGPRVTELKPWVRAAVTTWVLTTVAVLTAVAALILVNAPSYLTRTWQSLILQAHWVGHSVRIGSVVDVLSGAIGIFTLVLPVIGITLLFLLLCWRLGASLARRHARAKLALASPNEEKTLPARSDEVPAVRAPTTLTGPTRELPRGQAHGRAPGGRAPTAAAGQASGSAPCEIASQAR